MGQSDPACHARLSELLTAGNGLPAPPESLVELEERLLRAAVSRGTLGDGHFQMALDYVAWIGRDHCYLFGWIFDAQRQLADLRLVAPGATPVALQPHLHPVPRPDVAAMLEARFGDRRWERHGFVAFVPLPEPPVSRAGARLRATLQNGETLEVGFPAAPADPFLARRQILCSFPQAPFWDRLLMERTIGPALSHVQQLCRRDHVAAHTLDVGSPPDHPEVSLIIPLFRRLDLMTHQVVQFSQDPHLRDCEIVYVLDSPELYSDFEQRAFELHALYGVPLRAVTMRRNCGYGPANNVAAACSRGQHLLFLNSDVLPLAPGWLATLLHFRDSLPHPGAVGAKLLFEDDSLQHAGLFFNRAHHPRGLWLNVGPLKGMPRHYPPAAVNRPVPAVTGALMLLDRRHFDQVGGWDESYICGDYEDSDLCLRLYQSGLTNWYCADVELFHPERQSMAPIAPEHWFRNAAFHNCWLQTTRWNDLIEVIVKNGPTP